MRGFGGRGAARTDAPPHPRRILYARPGTRARQKPARRRPLAGARPAAVAARLDAARGGRGQPPPGAGADAPGRPAAGRRSRPRRRTAVPPAWPEPLTTSRGPGPSRVVLEQVGLRVLVEA